MKTFEFVVWQFYTRLNSNIVLKFKDTINNTSLGSERLPQYFFFSYAKRHNTKLSSVGSGSCAAPYDSVSRSTPAENQVFTCYPCSAYCCAILVIDQVFRSLKNCDSEI